VRDIVQQLPPFVTTVGLFVDATPEQVREVLAQVPLSLLQFHGDECCGILSAIWCAVDKSPSNAAR
jgi:phosphoribosylanthranilate isomerase